MDDITTLALHTIQKGKQAIIFTPSRASAEKAAENIAKVVKGQESELEQDVLKAASVPTKQCKRLAKCIIKGIAFHHAGLVNKQKELIEDNFRVGKIKIICATPTLAAGLSLPVFRVIIKSLKRYSGKWGMDWIPVLEYLQMAGRAGRPEYESYGEAISLARDQAQKEEIYEKYVCGEPEDIYSKLAAEPVLRMYLLSLVSSGIIRDENSMKEFFGKTFWAAQFGDMAQLEKIMYKMLSLLEQWDFISVIGEGKGEFVSASDLGGQKKLRATQLGRRISELYLDPLTARHLLDCMLRFDEGKNVFSLLQMICHTLEMRPLLRIKAKEQDWINDELIARLELLLENEPSAFDVEYGAFMNSIKTSLFFEGWISEQGEDFLFEKFAIRPGEIRMKVEVADWLLYACEELAKVQERRELIKELRKLRVRIKYGVKEELLVLLKLKGIGRVRARKLYRNGVKDVGDIKKISLVSLAQIVGNSVAASLKEQIGETVTKVPKGKRVGQLSLEKYSPKGK